MESFQNLPPPILMPDLLSMPAMDIPPPAEKPATMGEYYPKQQANCPDSENEMPPMTSNMLPAEEGVVQMMTNCSMDTPDCSSGVHSTNSQMMWTPAPPSFSSSNTFSDYSPPPSHCQAPPPSSPPQQTSFHANQQLPDLLPGEVVEEFEKIMSDENDTIVLSNSVILLFRFSIDSVRGPEVCQALSNSRIILSRLYYILLKKNDPIMLCYATGNLTNVSKYEEGRAALLRCFGQGSGIDALMCSLQSRDSNVVIFAITAIHNLLLDRRIEIQETAKEKIRSGIRHIVSLLDHQDSHYEFTVVVLDCLQILAYGNQENRLLIKQSDGPRLVLQTIKNNFDGHQTEELIETASRVLKSLSACPENKPDIIKYQGIDIMTHCIERNNQEILKTCLWTLRNLSDLINDNTVSQASINRLVERLLRILDEYDEDPRVTTCALGVLANLTCNNERIKERICECRGVQLLLNTITFALRGGRDFCIADMEILEPAVCTLCHLMNQTNNTKLAYGVKLSVQHQSEMFKSIRNSSLSNELRKAVEKLMNLASIDYWQYATEKSI